MKPPADTAALPTDLQDFASRSGPQDADVLIHAWQTLARVRSEDRARDERQGGLYFDVSDLLHYFRTARVPTGIQRVQISVVRSLLAVPAVQVRLCCYVEARRSWMVVSDHLMSEVMAASLADGDATAPSWRSLMVRLDAAVSGGHPMNFEGPICLVSLGTSWWLPNYFMWIRQAKIAGDVTFLPLVHDLIPILAPQFCDEQLVGRFLDWFAGILSHADAFLVVSEATRRDLLLAAGRLGIALGESDVQVVPLGADVPAAQAEAKMHLSRLDLRERGYALVVGTIEARKNQIACLTAWQRLIATHGADRIPDLVLVGRLGHQGNLVVERLRAIDALHDKVRLIHDVAEAELSSLYSGALFVLFPSRYEGWGLPVTEALAHGRNVIAASNSSIPEAGFGHAVLFEDGSTAALVAAVERLTFDNKARRRGEASILADLSLRTWREVAMDVHDAAGRLLSRAVAREDLSWSWSPPLLTSGYLPMRRSDVRNFDDYQPSAERLRRSGWLEMEEDCSRVSEMDGLLAFCLPAELDQLALELVGLADSACCFTVSIGEERVEGRLGAGRRKWVTVRLPNHSPLDVLTCSLSSNVASPMGRLSSQSGGIGLASLLVGNASATCFHVELLEMVALGTLDDRRPKPASLRES